MRNYVRYLSSLCGLLLLATLIVPSVAAATNSSASGTITQSYNAGPAVLSGMVVEFTPKDQATVTPLTSKDIRNMLGVVVPANDTAIVLTPQSTSVQQVLVATGGRYGLLVSNQNGPVKSGDYLTISALAGISMKATPEEAEVVGRAAASFNGTGNVIGTVPLKNSLGHTTTAAIGYIPVTVHLAPNPLFQDASSLPGFLSKAANGVANKPVSTARVYLAAFVLLATLFITGSMFYGGVRSGIVATGRNPLAKKAIGRSLTQTMAAAFIIFVLGILALYLILNL